MTLQPIEDDGLAHLRLLGEMLGIRDVPLSPEEQHLSRARWRLLLLDACDELADLMMRALENDLVPDEARPATLRVLEWMRIVFREFAIAPTLDHGVIESLECQDVGALIRIFKNLVGDS
jgi:hypothetical protein